MPTFEFGAIIASYVVIAVLLLGLNLYSRWSWWIKVLTNIVVAAFFWVSYHSIPELLGWPTRQDIPKRFYLHAANIDEPNKIYLWGTDLDRGLGVTRPRSFELDYDKSLHQRVDKATRKLRKGLPVIGETGTAAAISQEMNRTDETATSHSDIHFIDAPEALIPGKEQ